MTEIDRMPATDRPSTICDMASRVPPNELERALDEESGEGEDALEQVRMCLRLRGRIQGAGLLHGLLDQFDPRMAATRSEVERICLRIARDSGIDGIVTDHRICDRYGRPRFFDLAIPHLKIGIEIDTDRHHGSRLGRRRDGSRQNAVVLVDWLVLRFDDDLRNDPERVIAEIRRAIALRDGRPS